LKTDSNQFADIVKRYFIFGARTNTAMVGSCKAQFQSPVILNSDVSCTSTLNPRQSINTEDARSVDWVAKVEDTSKAPKFEEYSGKIQYFSYG